MAKTPCLVQCKQGVFADNIITMVQTLFFLQFKAQLCRTRPEMIRRLENAIHLAIREAGGKITGERLCIAAEYDQNNIGFWLDILMLVEKIQNILKAEEAEIYGYAFLIGKDLPEKAPSLCRSLASGPKWGGIFFDSFAQKALSPYVAYGRVQSWPLQKNSQSKDKLKNDYANLARLEGLVNIMPNAEQSFSNRESVVKVLMQGSGENTVIFGPEFSGKRDGLYSFCREALNGLPPLVFRFNLGGLNAFVDSWTHPIRLLAAETGREEENKEIQNLWEFLFKERLRQDFSPFILQKCARFLNLLLELYSSSIKQKGKTPVLILENIHLAKKTAIELFMGWYNEAKPKKEILVLGTCADTIENSYLKQWENVFTKLIKSNAQTVTLPLKKMPNEIWEMAFAFSLFLKYFPANMFLQLFEEEGKNPNMVSCAMSMLCSLKIIDTPEDPRPRIPNFNLIVQTTLGKKADALRSAVCRRLLSWVAQRKINPSFNLLAVFSELGYKETIDVNLILKSIYTDMVAGIKIDIEEAGNLKILNNVAGEDKAAVICFIYHTMQALLHGDEKEIKNAYNVPPPECSDYPVLKAQILANNAAYHFGLRNMPLAVDNAKEAIQLGQRKNSFNLAQSYRLFSLAALSKKRTNEASDYLDFAMDNAEKSGEANEFCVSAYYAAICQYLSGNISRALRLARKAFEAALAAGRPDWADRSRFFEGRLMFEIGCYREALDIFESLKNIYTAETTPGKEQVLLAWCYRAKVYLQNPSAQKPCSGGSDADLFEVEAAYFAGEYQKTIELTSTLSNPFIEKNFLYTEQPDWSSGFAQSELLYFSQGEIWDRLVQAYRSLALCQISEAAGEEAMRNMHRLLREEQLSEMDPWDAFYFYVWYRISEQIGAGHVDMNTAVSLAFKRLQQRASRIDDIEIRRQFLSQPRWNNALSQAAREFKLI